MKDPLTQKTMVKKISDGLLRKQVKTLIHRGLYVKGTLEAITKGLKRQSQPIQIIEEILKDTDQDTYLNHLDDKTLHFLVEYAKTKIQEHINTLSNNPIVPPIVQPVISKTKPKNIPLFQCK